MRSRLSPTFFAAILAACGGSTPPAATTPPTTTEPTETPAEPTAPPETPVTATPDKPSGGGDYKGLGAESVTAETIAKFAAKPLPGTVSRRIQSMLDIRGTGGGVVTSKGDRIVFGWSITGTPQVWRQDGPMKFPVQLTGGEDVTQLAGIAHDDSFIVVQRDVGGEENPGLYLMDIDGGPLTLIQHTKKVQTVFGFVSDDDKWIYYYANDVAPDSYAIYRWNVKDRKGEQLFAEPGLWTIGDHRG